MNAVTTPAPTSTLSLQSYLQVIRRQRWIIIVVTLLTGLLAVLPSLAADSVYASEARVRISPLEESGIFQGDNEDVLLANERAAELLTEIEILQSSPLRTAVLDRLPAETPAFTGPKVTQVGFSDIVEIEVKAGEASTAADVANAYADAFIEDRRARAVETLVAKVDELRDQSAALGTQVDAITSQFGSEELPPGEIASLQARQASLLEQIQEYDRRADEFEVEADLRGRGTEITSPAALNLNPVNSGPLSAGVLGLVLGLLLGLTIAVVVDTVQDRLGSRDDLAEVNPSTPVLAAVPHADFAADFTAAHAPWSFAVQEAYRYLRTGVRVFGLNSNLRSVLVTSAIGAEGKTTTASNLASAMADAGDRVVLVDCDLRRPALHKRYALPNDVGLTSVVVGDAALADAIHFVQDNLAVIPAGPAVQNPTELLGSEQFAKVLRAVVGQADFTILDSPPVLPVADALIAGQVVDGVIAVSRIGGVRRRAVREMLRRLDEAGIPLIGLVANDTTEESARYKYGPVEEREPSPKELAKQP